MLSHNSLAAILRTKFLLNVECDWTYDSVDQMIPWQLEAHLIMYDNHMREKEAARKAAR